MKRRVEGKKSKKGIIIVISIILVLAAGSTYMSYVYNKVKYWNDLIYPGVKIEEVDLSGKTKKEAIDLIKAKYGQQIVKKNINISAASKSYKLGYDKLKANYNIEDTVNEAFAYEKDLKFYSKYTSIKNPKVKTYKLKFSYDQAPIKELVANVEKDVNKDPVNAKISMNSNGTFNITADETGYKLQKEKLEKDILEKINGDLSGDIELKAAVDEVKASITEDKLKTINTKVSSYSSNYGSISSTERANNIVLATRSINGTLVMPGDSFSFNGVLGKRTGDKGYQQAPVVVGNKVETDFGGGICQVSSSLYNAIIKCNIKATERTHHTLPSSYVGLGMDATVDYGSIDYKFTNTLNFPIYIQSFTSNGVLYFNIYSNSSLTNRTYEFATDVYQTLQPNTKTVEDPNIPVGQQEIVQKAYVGYKVKVYLVTYENGKEIKKDFLYEDYYKPVDGLIKKGTKK